MSHEIFLNQGEIFAISSATPEISLMIVSNLHPFHELKISLFLTSILTLCLEAFNLSMSSTVLLISEAYKEKFLLVFLAIMIPTIPQPHPRSRILSPLSTSSNDEFIIEVVVCVGVNVSSSTKKSYSPIALSLKRYFFPEI